MKPYWMYCVFNVYCLVYSNKSCVIANMSTILFFCMHRYFLSKNQRGIIFKTAHRIFFSLSYILIFIYFFKYESIVRSSAQSLIIQSSVFLNSIFESKLKSFLIVVYLGQLFPLDCIRMSGKMTENYPEAMSVMSEQHCTIG